MSSEDWNPEVLPPNMIFVLISFSLIIKASEVEQHPLFVCFKNERRRVTYYPEMA